MKCEIQIQTILNHAWAEMAHDTIYKAPILGNFGGKAFDDIESRMRKIARKYLVPAYSQKEGEFIVFSEYPLGKGVVDFVVFASRSKMHIKFIEIKGADFNFLNADGTVSKAIKNAEEQIRERFEFVRQGYENFRRESHELRRQVEGGKVIYNSVIGKYGKLLCDSEKEILISGVVIGGRTTDDHIESNKKAQMQIGSSPQILFESWDSFLENNKNIENENQLYKEMLTRKNLDQISAIPIGRFVKNLIDYAGVPCGTRGVVDEHWQSSQGISIMVAWDLPNRPLPKNYRIYDSGININILRDGFTPNEFKNLEVCAD